MVETAKPVDEPVRILLIDDDEDDYALTKSVLAEMPNFRYTLDWDWNFDSALTRVCSGEHDVYLIDYRLGEKTGIDLLVEMRKQNCRHPVILLTGQSGMEIDLAAMEAGAADFLEKGRLDPTVLARTIRYARQQHRHEMALEEKVAARTAELARANEMLREADHRKDEFLSTLAHELRNPLSPIRNALEIMRISGGNPTALERCREVMERQVGHLIRLIDDLLDVSRISRNKFSLQLGVERISDILEVAIEVSRPLIDKAGIELAVRIPDEPLKVRGDRIRLAQVFANILNNASKYTPTGGKILLSVEKRDSRVEIRVRDNGAGLPPEMLPEIFELFTQVDRKLNRSHGGLGIGLSLAKRIVEMHGGTIEAASEGPDKGTEFVVSIPLV